MKTGHPYEHPVFITILEETFFKGSKSIINRFNQRFLETFEGKTVAVIPNGAIGLIATAVSLCLFLDVLSNVLLGIFGSSQLSNGPSKGA